MSQCICLIGHYFFPCKWAFSSLLQVQCLINDLVTSLQYTSNFTCQYNLDSINSVSHIFSCIRLHTIHKTTLVKKQLTNALQMVWSHVAHNFVSCFPYLVGNTETRKIGSQNFQATTAKQIWIIALLVSNFLDTLLWDCCLMLAGMLKDRQIAIHSLFAGTSLTSSVVSLWTCTTLAHYVQFNATG